VHEPVRIENAGPRQLAAARGSSTRPEVGRTIIRLLDLVWPVLRAQKVQTGHNVVIYHYGLEHIEAGVEVFGDFVETADVRRSATPSGRVVTATHQGDYAQMHRTYDALTRYCTEQRLLPTGLSWEVYGDPAPDPARTRTDIYLLLGP
jgi:effector-binding domain-containing protein